MNANGKCDAKNLSIKKKVPCNNYRKKVSLDTYKSAQVNFSPIMWLK